MRSPRVRAVAFEPIRRIYAAAFRAGFGRSRERARLPDDDALYPVRCPSDRLFVSGCLPTTPRDAAVASDYRFPLPGPERTFTTSVTAHAGHTRDTARGRNATTADYIRRIHAAVQRSNGICHYTGEWMHWQLLKQWSASE